MRTKLILILCLFIAFRTFSQETDDAEQSRIKPGMMWYYNGVRPHRPEYLRKYDRLIFDLTYNDWIGDRQPFGNHWASIGFNTNFMFDIPLTKGNTVALGIGLCHQLIRIRHDNVIAGDDANKMTMLYPKDSTDTFDKGVLGGNNLSIPIELRFRKESWRHLKLHLGGRFGYQLNLYNKYVFDTNTGKQVVKAVGFPDQSDLVYSAHIRVGIRNWAFYGSYSFNPLFTSSKSTELRVLQFGLSLSLF